PRRVGAGCELSQNACARRSRHGGRASPGAAGASGAGQSCSVRTPNDDDRAASQSTPSRPVNWLATGLSQWLSGSCGDLLARVDDKISTRSRVCLGLFPSREAAFTGLPGGSERSLILLCM